MRKIRLHDNELKIGWGKASPVASPVVMAVQQFGATRNVRLRGASFCSLCFAVTDRRVCVGLPWKSTRISDGTESSR